MTQHNSGLIRLVPLLSAGEDIDNLEDAKLPLLNLCVQKSIRGYLRVPSGHVAVIYRYAKKEPSRSLFGRGKPVLAFKRGPVVARQVRFVGLDVADIQDIRDARSTTVEGFLHGGLEAVRDGLLPIPFEYAVVQKDYPNSFAADRGFQAETLLEGQVYPITAPIGVGDVLVAVEDANELRKLLGAMSFQDKWGHKKTAPNVFLVYRVSQDPYDLDGITETLIANDPHKIFDQANATTVARIIKINVRPNAERKMALHKISKNETGKDYTDPTLSKRISLLLLATDCWIHDRSARAEMEGRMAPIREDAVRKRDQLGKKALEALDQAVFASEQAERAALQPRLYMPSGLRAYLSELGFTKNQVEHLYCIITQTKVGGRHVGTEKDAAKGLILAKARRLKRLSGNRPPSPA